MKILVLSKEAWRDEQNGGNVLSNIFSKFEDSEFAQIYCTEAEPNNAICKHYFQITDHQIVNSIFGRGKAGIVKDYPAPPLGTKAGIESYKSAKKLGDFIRVAREIAWWMGRWNKKEILKFAYEFNPDLIFAPCYGNHYMHKLTELVHDKLKVPIVSYISDDFYSNNQVNYNPIFWINHFFLRKHTREIFKRYNLVYTMTEEQKIQCEKDFIANMKILCKSGTFEDSRKKKNINIPIRFVYGGGIYINRWKTLEALADAMRKINADGVKMVLDIYTNTSIPENAIASLNDGMTTRMHAPIPMVKLREEYAKSDVALHCEGFDKKSQHIVRLSFSTKIVDCLDSGCAVMAICDLLQAGFAYLERNDAAICVSELDKLEDVLRKIVANPKTIIEYQHKAFELGRKNHLQENIDSRLKNDFENCIFNK